MFPVTDSSQTIIDCLMKEANKYAVEIRMNKEVKGIYHDAGTWNLLMKDDAVLKADFICIASGGYPKILQYDWLKKTEHYVEEPVSAEPTYTGKYK